MDTAKAQRAGVGFAIGRQESQIILNVRIHHDTIPILRGVRIGFELLNGLTPEQGKRIIDVLNENIVGVLVIAASDGKTEAAAG